MNKKEVSLFLTGVTGRRLCTDKSAFLYWVEKRLGRTISLDNYNFYYSAHSLSKEITDSITDEEWREIADFFIEAEEEAEDAK